MYANPPGVEFLIALSKLRGSLPKSGPLDFATKNTVPLFFAGEEALRAPVCKNQTNSKFRGKGGQFDFFHILMLHRPGYN